MVRDRQVDQLEHWLCTVEHGHQGDLKAFALGIRRDQRAVANVLALPWSNGPTEGAITRLKLNVSSG